MKKGMTIFALTTILCGAAAITENHNQAFARSGSHSSGHSASSGRSSHSSGHSASSGRSTNSKGNNATVGRSTNSKGHSVTAGNDSNFKGHTAVVGRNSNLKTTNAATKGKNVNTKNVANSKNSATSLVANHNKAYNKKSNETTNYKNIANSHLDTLVVGHNKAFTKKSTKPTNSKNIAISHLDTIVAEHDKAFISKTLNSKTVATKKYKTKEEISKLSTVQLLKDIIKNRDGKGITQLHGNYCGPGHGDIKNGPPPVDLLDLGCKIHDIGYDQKGYFNRDVNNRFIEFVNKNASKMKPAEREKAYYYAEGFERMNKTPLQEVAKVASIISAPVRMAYNLISDGVKGTVNLISKGVKAIGSLFNSNRIISFGTVPHRNIERAGDRGSGNNPFLLQNQPRRAR